MTAIDDRLRIDGARLLRRIDQLAAIGAHAEAIPRLEGPPGLLPEPALDERRRELLAEALWRTGALDRAEAEWSGLLEARSSRTRALAREGVDRVRWSRSVQ
jgi:hypothetical protein